jgi:iron complex outermembrane recepter protein
MTNVSRHRNDRKLNTLYVAVALALGTLSISHVSAQTAASAAKPEVKKAETEAEKAQSDAKRAEADANAGGLETIVVTAQRREERAQTVPIAMSAFTGAALERRNITDALSLIQYVPNLIGSNNTGLGTANTYFIRGIGDTESLASKDPPVATYIDDILFSRQSANNFAFFDVDRIEVLRGPQGTLFGRNTTGGSINVHLKKPSATSRGYLEGGIGSFGQLSLRGGFDAPFSPTVLTKFSGYWNDDDGYVQNTITNETLNGRKNYGARAAIRAFVSDNVLWDGFAVHMYSAGANLTNFECNPAAPTNCDDRYATTGLRQNNSGANQFPGVTLANGKGNLPLGNVTKTDIWGSNLAFSIGDTKVNLITGYVDTRQKYVLDFFDGRGAPGYTFVLDPATGRPSAFNIANNVSAGGVARGRPGGFAIAAEAISQQFTQEVKVTGSAMKGFIDYVGGVFYMNEKNYSDFADLVAGTGPDAAPPAPPFTVTLLADRVLRNDTKAWAAYTQLDFNLTDKLKLTTGARFTDEKKDYNFSDNRAICQVTPLPVGCIDNANFINNDNDLNPATPAINIPRNQSIKIWTPRVALNYKLNEDLLLYTSATKGFKSGGQSARATAVRLLLPFNPETIWSYEVGARTEWFDKRLRVNATAFSATTKDLQGGSAFVTTNLATGAQTLSFVTRNFADLENKGLELDITAVPVKGLNLNLAAGYQDAKYKLDPSRVDQYGTVSTVAQQRECLAAIAGQASPRGDTRLAAARAQSSCGNGVVTPTGDIAKPVRTPKWTISGGVSYDIQVASLGGTLTPSANFVYTSEHEVGSANVSIWRNASGVLNAARDGTFVTGSYSAARTVTNLGLGFRTNDKLWTASLNCSNCTDKAYPQAALSNFSYLNEPRRVSFSLKRVF